MIELEPVIVCLYCGHENEGADMAGHCAICGTAFALEIGAGPVAMERNALNAEEARMEQESRELHNAVWGEDQPYPIDRLFVGGEEVV